MGHNCGSTCKRDTGAACDTCRVNGGRGKPRRRTKHKRATPQMVGAAVDMYYDGLSYRDVAENVEDYFGRRTNQGTILRWTRNLTDRARNELHKEKIQTGDEWVADEMQVNVGGKKYWLFNVMDSKTRVVLAAYLSPNRTGRAAATVMKMARSRAARSPKTIKTDGLKSYQGGIGSAFPHEGVRHVVSQGIRAKINNNLSERLQGTFRGRDKTLRALKSQESGQDYIDGLVVHYNYFRPHQSLDDKTPAEEAGVNAPYKSWQDVAADD